ncbi:unnamed protein product [Ranitomeya imitator]|uniref:Fibrinogen C-terminal domain-containing protein n=1 Tax=Ranitomeya imitator TaxID=111125 RepID=A0ABN9LEK5_9NEOB|nr:unnamed protein product [Ranitomeya imitator]
MKAAVGKERGTTGWDWPTKCHRWYHKFPAQRADWESLRKRADWTGCLSLGAADFCLRVTVTWRSSSVSVSEVLDSVHGRSRGKGDLIRSPAKSSRPRGCTNEGVPEKRDGSVNFFRGWEQYRDGFGKLTGEHWLGLQRLHLLTMQTHYQLRIDLADFENSTAYAQYNTFGVGLYSVNPEDDGYPLTVSDYSGTAGDSLGKHTGMKFTTKDLDNDHSENNCASFYHGAWWYRNCHTSNLNGQYLHGHHASYADGIEWSSWTGWQYSLKFYRDEDPSSPGGTSGEEGY